MDASAWIPIVGVIVGATAATLIPMYARHFRRSQKDLETLTTELGILVAMKDSGQSIDGSGELASLIEDRLANYLKRDHPGAIRT